MATSTRQRILDTARELFNRHGYNGVSLRDIAKEVGISEGNLTYHFKRKESLVDALLTEDGDASPAIAPRTLGQLDAAFSDMSDHVQGNLYYFLHYAQLAQASPEICRKQNVRYAKFQDELKSAFNDLHASGLLRDELFEGEYDDMIDTLYISVVYWAPFQELKQPDDLRRRDCRRHAWACLYPLLTSAGRIELEGIVQL